VIHFAMVLGILVGLGFLNYALDVGKLLDTPHPLLRRVWLALLFLLVYLLAWVGWWLWTLLGAEQESSAHADLDAAWAEATNLLKEARIDISELPLFLVLGRPAGPTEALLKGAQLDLVVERAPRDSFAPLHVYANHNAIFVTCEDASLLAHQAALFAEESETNVTKDEPTEPQEPDETPWAAAGLSGVAGVAVAAAPKQSTLAPAGARSQASLQITAQEQAAGLSFAEAIEPPPPTSAGARPQLLKDTAEVERLTARLKHLCWLIRTERRPYCPLNGVLLLIPFAATGSEAEANQTGLICQRDLTAVQEVMQVHCPVFALVCDMERVTGFREFVDRFPKGHRQRRLGQQFPYVANLTAAEGAKLIEGGVEWVSRELFPSLVYRLMRPEKSVKDKNAPMTEGNARLYRLLCLMRERQKPLSRILALAIVPEVQGPILFGGCYFAATGSLPSRQQAFIAAVFQRLIENQNFVSSEAEERAYRRWMRFGYSALALFVVFLFVFGYLVVFRKES
jgi:type VI protein secretion system component VasK